MLGDQQQYKCHRPLRRTLQGSVLKATGDGSKSLIGLKGKEMGLIC